MTRFRIRSFQGRIFLAILVVVLVPATLAVGAGVVTLQGIGSRSGTLGAWDAVAESGRELLESLDDAGVDDPEVAAAARAHRDALSESVRLSRLYAFVTDRFLTLLPLAALLSGVVVTGLALITARYLSRGFGRPIAELAGWTERIGRGEELPPPAPDEARELVEIRTLRTSLRQMADELEEGRRQAVDAARLRSWTDLARRVAHELKNPLTPMRMAAATLAGDPDPRRAQAATVLEEEIARLDAMARTFAQYGRMPEGPRSDVDVGELLAALARQHATPDLAIRVDAEPAVVHAHYDALERAFRNLVVNAVEAADGAPGRVEVTVRSTDRFVDVELRDHGPGIPPELLGTVWNPDVTTKRRGTGLGLAMVRQTIHHHDGTVEAANAPEGGAVFRVRLPARPVSDPSKPPGAAPDGASPLPTT